MNGSEEEMYSVTARNSNSAPPTDFASIGISELERRAFQRVQSAGVRAPESAILRFVRSVGSQTIFAAKLCDIRAIANAF
jgi:hypothetical protein